MKKTAGAILAKLLLAKEKGATPKELKKIRLELTKQTRKQLKGPVTNVTVAVEIRD